MNGYANGWYITDKDIDGRDAITITLEMRDQKYFIIGLAISFVCMLFLTVGILYSIIRNWLLRKRYMITQRYVPQARKYLIANNNVVISLLSFMVLVDIFMIPRMSDVRTYGTLFLYAIDTWVIERKSKTTFIGCLALLLLMYVLYLFTGTSEQTEKVAVWLFLLLLIGVVQIWNE